MSLITPDKFLTDRGIDASSFILKSKNGVYYSLSQLLEEYSLGLPEPLMTTSPDSVLINSAKYFKCSIIALKSDNKSRFIVKPRMMIMFYLRLNYTGTIVANLFNRDHSTVTYAEKILNKSKKENNNFYKEYLDYCNYISPK